MTASYATNERNDSGGISLHRYNLFSKKKLTVSFSLMILLMCIYVETNAFSATTLIPFRPTTTTTRSNRGTFHIKPKKGPTLVKVSSSEHETAFSQGGENFKYIGGDPAISDILSQNFPLSATTTEIKTLVHHLVGTDQYIDFLSANENQSQAGQITVVRFYASWCRACQRLDPRYTKLLAKRRNRCSENQPDKQLVRFADVDYGNSANVAMCEYMEVTKLPCVHVYQLGFNDNDDVKMPKRECILVCEPKMSQSHFVDMLDNYLTSLENNVSIRKEC